MGGNPMPCDLTCLQCCMLLFGGQAGATPITGEGPRRSVSHVNEAAAVRSFSQRAFGVQPLLALARGS